MRADTKLTPHFYLSHLVVSPWAARAGLRNQPGGVQVDNLQRLAYTLEGIRSRLGCGSLTVLRAFRRQHVHYGPDTATSQGRSADFIAPAYGSPRQICAFIIGEGLGFDKLVCTDDWVQLDIPAFGEPPKRLVQTGVFEDGKPMRFLEGLL